MGKYFYLVVVVLSLIGLVALFSIGKLLVEKPDIAISGEKEPYDGPEIIIDEYDFDHFIMPDTTVPVEIIKPDFSISVESDEIEKEVHFHVIAGSFGQKENAVKLVEKLQNMGYPSADMVYDPETKLTRVIVGDYTDKEEAQKIKDQFEMISGISTYMKTVSPEP